ncbi:iron uptake transporter deferrochelatase/peroxidase subunit [Corynebacterium bovis]|uniref:iron uptake transporter deferrochelatase/peroxidase subunit n=1 Tax=Corynebacterium bovis TaxID=36808 RepID=UPI0031387A3D
MTDDMDATTSQQRPPEDGRTTAATAASPATAATRTGTAPTRAPGVPRRRFLAGMGVGVLGTAAVGGGILAATGRTEDVVAAAAGRATTPDPDGTVPFRGAHQAGVTTAQQEHLHIVAFDVTSRDRAALRDMLRRWTSMAERMTRGETTVDGGSLMGDDATNQRAADRTKVPQDTGEATDLPTANLTLTVSFGPSLFDDRFGLADRRPRELTKFPTFPGDQLRDDLSYGDIVVQACADDPQVAVHAVRNLARAGSGVVQVRWSQLGYGRASSTSTDQTTPRNLFGFKDGTRNLKSEDGADIERFVWATDDGWMTGGTYLCARRIRMLLELWDRQILDEQQHTFARYKGSGAPLGTDDEFADVPFDLTLGTEPAVPTDSHVYLAHPDQHGGARILRRAYNFVDGSDSVGHINGGLFFIAFVAKPSETFIPIQLELSRKDKMNEYVRYESAALFACPPGLRDGEDWGTALFGE